MLVVGGRTSIVPLPGIIVAPSKSRVKAAEKKLRDRMRGREPSWTPQMKRLYGVPTILDQEAASSWICRVAIKLRIRISVLLEMWGADVPVFWLDGGARELDLPSIAQSCMLPVDSFRHLEWISHSLLALPRFACLTVEPFQRQPIYRYCECCLREDPVPYFRQYWRYASSYVCEVHGTTLRDTCPHCKSRVDLSRFKGGGKVSRDGFITLRDCLVCRKDLADCESNEFPVMKLPMVVAAQLTVKALLGKTVARRHAQDFRPEVYNVPGAKISRQKVDYSEPRVLMEHLSLALHRGIKAEYKAFNMEAWPVVWGRLLRHATYTRPDGTKLRLYFGIDGFKLFGKDILTVAVNVGKCQSLLSGTVWYRNSDLFKHKEVFHLTETSIPAVLRWIDVRGPSVQVKAGVETGE